MTPEPSRPLPPSFTPQGGRSARPDGADGVITVGPEGTSGAPGGEGTPGPTGSTPSVPPPPPRPAPRVTRQSSQPVPVRAADGRAAGGHTVQRAARPASYPPASRPRTTAPGQDGTRAARTARGAGGDGSAGTAPRGAASTPNGTPSADDIGTGGRLRLRKGRVALVCVVVLLAAMVAWPVGIAMWANGKLQHVDALSDAADTPGTTYLIAGSDSRADGVVDDGTSGARTDSIMLLQVPDSGPTALISIPRDSYVKIPGHGSNKINAAYSWGGATLLVETVEQLTGMHVDHYVEVGFGGVEDVVDAIGGVHLCYDRTVNDKKSELKWKKGCHDVDGKTALAFSRMRYSDPLGDFGRTERQRQLVGAIGDKVKNPALLFQPAKQVQLVDAGTSVLTVDQDANILDVARLALAFQAAQGKDGVTGTPPIANPDYRTNAGSSVLLDPDKTPAFFTKVMKGTLDPGTYGGL